VKTILNHITIQGRLTRDPEYRTTATGISIANFSVAVDRDFPSQSGEKETDFIDCAAWRKTAEFVTKYFTKGSMIIVSGRLQINTWTDKDGNKRKSAVINAENVYFCGKKQSDENRTYNSSTLYTPQTASDPVPVIPTAADFALLDDDDTQLPF
jgi:single-strand DNA-binding protein